LDDGAVFAAEGENEDRDEDRAVGEESSPGQGFEGRARMKETILILTSCIGGGHVFRDLAIGKELKRLHPEHDIVFASGGAAYKMLAAEGGTVEEIAGMSFPAHLGTASFFRLYMEVLWSEWKQFFDLRRLIAKHKPALVVLDEYFFLADYCIAKGIPVVFMSDFVGVPQLPFFQSPARALLEKFFDWWIARWLPRRVDEWVFIGDSRHIPTQEWRDRAQAEGIAFVEPITKVQYTSPPSRDEARAKLGIARDAKVVTVAVGCTEVGGYLLDAANQAAAILREKTPDLQLEIVCGMSIPPDELAAKAGPGVRVHGYVRNFEEFLSASDAAVVQCGLTTTTECLMVGVPTIVVPLANHWEQANTARFLKEIGACESIQATEITPERLADAIAGLIQEGRSAQATYRGDGHVRAAQVIHDVLGRRSSAVRGDLTVGTSGS
jgi:UDP-N-acetylglucosamine:LPS N-acetylglucosamine transferase